MACEKFESDSIVGAPETVLQKESAYPGGKKDCLGSGSGCSDWNGSGRRKELRMDLVEFVNWLVPRVIAAGGVLLVAIAASRFF